MNGAPGWNELFADLLDWECGAEPLGLAQAVVEELHDTTRHGEKSETWPEVASRAELASAMRWYAPQSLTECVWLRVVNSMAWGHLPAHAQLFTVWLDAAGLEGKEPSLSVLFRAFAAETGVELPPATAVAWRDMDLPPAAFLPAAVHLAMERSATGSFPKLLGYTLAHWRASSVRLNWLERQCRTYGLAPAYLQRHRALLRKHRAALFELARDLPRDTSTDQSFRAGWRLREWSERNFLRNLRRALAEPATTAERAAALLKRLQPFATGHHGRILLEGKNLDDWLAAGDWEQLRQALRASPWFRQDAPETSPLFRAMAFGGPMFGVFDADEEKLLRDWLESPAPDPSAAPFSCPSLPSAARRQPPTLPNLRALFHELVNENDAPPVQDAAERHIRRILRWTAPLDWVYRGALAISPYSRPMLRERVFAAYRQEMARYRPPEQRQAVPAPLCRWGIEQLAPAIWVDGSWLRHLGRLEPVQDGVVHRLTRIFCDETGAGQAEHHHGNVYRRLLAEQGIHLPELASWEFADHPRLKTASFVLPAYLLAIGSLPERFFPELLGLNLAIELSGLGAGYMHAVDDMQRHGMDPLIIRLHLSIDNLADGHAALALEAIEEFLEETHRKGGAEAVEGHWRRIRRGFLSLRAATVPFLLAGIGAWLRCR
ncbi:MAG TPA: iron-containing redox enzyme family protein [Methylococcaceae bacterium]|nr:iron-containing redox enzyme family protein [Methylococcaceae bacterium]